MMPILVPMLIGAGLLLLGFFQFRKVRASQAWPSVTGRIVAAKVDVTESRGDENTADSTSYTPTVRYEYQVGGQMLQGDRIAFVGRAYADLRSAEKALAAYPLGGAVTVYFDPAKPAKAVLERAAAGGRLLIALGLGVLLLGLVALVKK